MFLGFIEGWCKEKLYVDGFCISYKIIFEGIIRLYYLMFFVKKILSDIFLEYYIRGKECFL